MRVREARQRYVQWLLTSRSLSSHTIRAYEGDIAAFERHVGPHAGVVEISGPALLAFVDEQRAQGLAPASIRRRACGVRGFCAWLQSSGLITEDPWARVTLDLGRGRRLPRPLSAHNLDLLLRSLRTRAGVSRRPLADGILVRPSDSTTLLAVALMVATGLRAGEVVAVRHQDLDLPGRALRVVGKGMRERQVFLPDDWIASLARAYLHTRVECRVDHDRLLFNQMGAPLTTSALRARLVKAAEVAGIQHRVTPHMLRHTAATQLIESGVDIRYVQRLLGHASLSTTELYTHVADHALKRVISDADVLGRSFARDN